MGNGSVSREREQGFTSDLYTCFSLKNTRDPISVAFSVLFPDGLLKKCGLGDCSPCTQPSLAVKPNLLTSQLSALLHWHVIEGVKSR